MKANETPEKIYINSSLENRTWLIGKGDTSFIEYTRTDAFIDKACKYLEPIIFSINLGDRPDTDKFIGGFRNYMKGER